VTTVRGPGSRRGGGTKRRALAELAVCRRQRLTELERLWVGRAREAGATWAEVGDAIGTTRQRAQALYGKGKR